MSRAAGPGGDGGSKSEYKDKDKPTQIRFSNITAAKGKKMTRLSELLWQYNMIINIMYCYSM